MPHPRPGRRPSRVTSLTFLALASAAGASCYEDHSLGEIATLDAGSPETGGPAPAGGAAAGGGAGGVAGAAGGGGSAAPRSDAGAPAAGGASGQAGAGGAGGAGGQGAAVACPTGPRPGAAPLRRLTRAEYLASVQDVLGVAVAADDLPAESVYGGFENRAEAQPASEVFVQGLASTAQTIAQQAVRNAALLPCKPEAVGEEACGQQFVATIGRLLFRRPLPDGELAFYTGAFQTARRAVGFSEAVRLILQAMLQAPRFVYRLEIGPGTPSGEPGVVRADGFDLATRLAYTLWATTPDAALLKTAEQGTLDTPQGVLTTAQRMWSDPRARRGLREFTRQWLEVARVAGEEKDKRLFPDWTPAIAGHLQEEVYRFVDDVVFGGGKLGALVTSSRTTLNGPLATFYGVKGPTGAEFTRVDLDPARSAGLFTKAGILAGRSHSQSPTPMARGLFVLRSFLCENLPEPPADVVVPPPPPSQPTATLRQRWEEGVLKFKDCHDCHQKTDYMGFALEHYDSVGRWRELDNGQPIDDTGRAGMPEMAIKGAAQLGAAVAADPRFPACVATHWFRYAQGRVETKDDACALRPAQEAVKHEGTFGAAPLAVTTLPTFQYRPAPASAAAPRFAAPAALDLPASLTPTERTLRQRLWVLDVTLKGYQAYAPLLPAPDKQKLDAISESLRQFARAVPAKP